MILRPRSKRRGCIQPSRLIPFGKAVALILSSYAVHVCIIQPDLEAQNWRAVLSTFSPPMNLLIPSCSCHSTDLPLPRGLSCVLQ